MFIGSKKFFLIALFTLALIAIVNVAWWSYYNRTRSLLEQQLSRRLAAIVETGVISLGPALVDSLSQGEFTAYAEAIHVLDEIRSADSLSEAFILDEDYHYLATTLIDESTSGTDSTYFLAGLNGEYIDSIFFGLNVGAVVTQSYKTGPLYLKSAFAPLRGMEGFPIAVLGVEANVDYFDALSALRRNLLYSSAISVLGGIALGLLFLLLQQRINRAEQQVYLGQTQAYLGRMVAVVAHELKNPLMIIRASAERLTKKAKSEESTYITEEVDRLNEIVTGYLDFARGDASLVRSESPVEYDLVELIQGIKQHLSGKYADTPITWLPAENPESLKVTGYRRSLRQVVFNLLTNGADSCISAKKPIELGVAVGERGKQIQIEIRDHGSGISKTELKKIFTPFYTTKQTGSGLGLYLSRKLVGEMGGEISISSTEGRGTEIVIELPRMAR